MPERVLAVRGPRSLLRQIREAMAGAAPAQAKLDMVVRIIAGSMVAEVCSIYLRRGVGDLELFATEGLSATAVHQTRLKPGEGLVSEIVRIGRPLNLQDAPQHPQFSYRPETGEDPFHAFLGVPLLRGGRPIGALIVQNRTERTYSEDEVEDLQTIAMVLSELVASGDLVGLAELKDVELAPTRPERLRGARFADGLAMGHAVLHEAPVASGRLLAEDAGQEESRLNRGLAALRRQLDEMLDGAHGLVGQSFEVLETYRMFAHDRGWTPPADGGRALGPVGGGGGGAGAVRAPRAARPGARRLPARPAARTSRTSPTACCATWAASPTPGATCRTTRC